MKIQNTKYNIKVNMIELTLFVFSMIFIGEIKGIDVRVIVDFFWLLYSMVKRVKTEIFVNTKQLLLIFTLFVFSIYVGVIFIASGETSAFYLFRIFRCIISSFVIFIFFSNTNITIFDISKSYILASSIHVMAVIGGYLNPQIREFVYLFNSYSKKYLPFRSSGLFSGYDYAGFFINIAVFIFGILLIKRKCNNLKPFLLLTLFMFSILMTSRFNTVVLVLNIFTLLIFSLKNKNKLAIAYFFSITIVGMVLGFLFMVISTTFFSTFRYYLISKFSPLNQLSTTIVNSYANYNVSDTVSSQFILPEGDKIIFGSNIKAPVDPGYVNSIFYIGIVGLFLMLSIYTLMMFLSISKDNHVSNIIVIFLYLITLVFEMKLSFLFSSGAFELFTIFWCVSILSIKKTEKI